MEISTISRGLGWLADFPVFPKTGVWSIRTEYSHGKSVLSSALSTVYLSTQCQCVAVSIARLNNSCLSQAVKQLPVTSPPPEIFIQTRKLPEHNDILRSHREKTS